MFNFITKKYKDQIKGLERQIQCMTWEWAKEKQLYSKKTKRRFLKQKVHMVIGEIDLNRHTEIHRPLCGLTEDEAKQICAATKSYLNDLGFEAQVSHHWRDSDSVFLIDVLNLHIV